MNADEKVFQARTVQLLRLGESKLVDSEDLFGIDREVLIKHGDAYYRLYKTRAGKLVLNK